MEDELNASLQPTPGEDEDFELLRQSAIEMEESGTLWGKTKAVAGDIGTGLKETPGQIWRGAAMAVNEAPQVLMDAMEWSNGVVSGALGLPDDGGAGFKRFREQSPLNHVGVPDALMPGDPESVTGGVVKSVSQFAAGFLAAGKFVKTGQAIGWVGKTGMAMVKGAVADFTVFDPHEERLSNLVEQYPSLQNPVSEYLAADPEDSVMEGRFKNAVEGLGLGAATEGLIAAVRGLKLVRAGKVDEAVQIVDEVEAKAKAEAEAPKPEEAAKPAETPEAAPATEATPEAVKPKKLVEVDEDELRELTSARLREQGFGQGRNLSGIRTDLMENGDDINTLMNSLRVVYREEMDKVVGGAEGVRTWDEVRRNVDRLADTLGAEPTLLLQKMANQADNLKHLDAETRLYEDVLTTVGTKLSDLADLVADPLGGLGSYKNRAELLDDFAKHFELLGNVQASYKGIQTNVARAMNAMKMGGKVREKLLAQGVNLDEVFAGGIKNMEALARRVKAAKGDPKALARVTRNGFMKNLVGSVNEYWVNSILSGAKTHMVNMGSSAFNTAFLPAERFIAGALRGGTQAGRAQMMEAGLHYAGVVASFKDAVRLSARALKMGDNILDPLHTSVEMRHAITARNWNVTNPIIGMIVNGLGSVVRLPNRFLAAEDEFFKQLNYRAEVRARAYREGLQGGLWKDPGKFADHVDKALDNAIDGATGIAKDRKALDNAREVTFTGDLKADTWSGKDTWGQTFQKAAESHPTMRVIMPFVRTPTNIMRFVTNRTPAVNLLRRQYQDDLLGRNGPEARAKAAAQMTTGAALWATAISFVADGEITGHGPRDPDIRKALMQTGWRPYSFKFTEPDGRVTYTAYDRFDPFGMFFGLAADFTEAIGAHPEETKEEVAMALSTALLKNLSSKSYLSGLIQAVGAFSEPERKSASYFRNLAAGFVPNLLNQQFKDDPHMREARSVMDALHARTPGLSESLDPQRNLFGEKVHVPPALGPDWLSPVARTVHAAGDQPLTEEWKNSVQSDPYDELARQMFVHESNLRQPPKVRGEVDFTKFRVPGHQYSAYDKWQELTGTIELDGKTFKQALSELINSDVYRNVLTDGDIDTDGSRIHQIRALLGAYRTAAEWQLREQVPELHDALIAEAQRKALWQIQNPVE